MSMTETSAFERYALWPHQLTLYFTNPGVIVVLDGSDLLWKSGTKHTSFLVGPEDQSRIVEMLDQVSAGDECSIAISEDAELSLNFTPINSVILIAPNPSFEAWSINFDPPVLNGISKIVCGPGGQLMTWR